MHNPPRLIEFADGRKVEFKYTKRRNRPYRPKTKTKLAAIVAQAMRREFIRPADLAGMTHYSTQYIYAAFSADGRGIRDFPFPFAETLLKAMGYTLEVRAVKK